MIEIQRFYRVRMNMQAQKRYEGRPAQVVEVRARAIVDLVRAQGFQTIDALAAEFSVTPQTIRRDVNSLCDLGLMRRRHGGVELPPQGENLAYQARQVLNIDAKRRIARMVADDVPERASLFFGIGTTPEQCALALVERAGLRVMTNNLNVAMLLCRNPGCEITIAGGRVRNRDRDVIGGECHDFFDRFAVDIGIFGVGGIAADGTLLDFSLDEVAVRRSLSNHCRQRYLVVDHSKFGRDATVRGGHITEASAVYTDQPVPAAIGALLDEAGVRLCIYPDESHPNPI
ncbi:MAG: DeoR/GlpR family DNA-binding transcription regulator [Sulfuritalea sp.]|nr:DeoR/GlpR family DNA-binding transcription regulator [Sulfuritalea sp.]MDP1981474.1 DeoR/GlpR family DNA-binding transcription regulator [Sulfuritalea sp.]